MRNSMAAFGVVPSPIWKGDGVLPICNSNKDVKDLGGDCIPCRHVIAMLGFLCVLVLYALKVNLSVAIVAMVNQPCVSLGKLNTTTFGTCPSQMSPKDGDFLPSGAKQGEFDWDESTQGLVLSAFYYGYVATQLLGGIAAVRWGGKVIVGPAIALTGVFTCISPLAARMGGVLPFIATRVLQGAASGVVFPALLSLFSLWFPPNERTQFAGITFASIHLGTVLGMTLSGYLVQLGGWPTVFYFFGIMGVIFLLPWWLLVYDHPEAHPRISEAEAKYLQQTLVNSKVDHGGKPPSVPWSSVLSCPAVWAVAFVHTGYAWVLFTFVSGLPTYMKNILHYDIQKSAFLASLPYLLQWLSSMASGVASQWLRSRGILQHLTTYRLMNGIFLLGSAASMLTITFLGCSYVPIIAMLSLYGVLGGMFYGGSYLNHMDIAVNFAGILSGINQTLSAAAGVLAPIVMGQLTQGKGKGNLWAGSAIGCSVASIASAWLAFSQTLGQWNIVFYIAIGISIGCYIFFHIFGSVEEQPWNKLEVKPETELERPAEETENCRF